MPVRIYDISKKLGMDSKQVIAKAKELGIGQARVPSSQLDKITAEFIEAQLRSSPPPSPGAQVTPTLVQPIGQHAKAPAITIRTISNEVHALVERVLAGEI